MKIKIGNKIYNSEEEPVLIILSDDEKELISDMDKDNYKFCSFPEEYPTENIVEFMKLEKKII